ncbi:MAG: carboxypeptidase regulatory-like domain-containing protein, partial [Bryobacteraceae bacterium]
MQNRFSFCRNYFSAIAFVLLVAAPATVLAQNGVISGTVTDSTQAVIPNASVAIVNADTAVTVWRGATNGSGLYRAPELPVGRYNVTVEAQGFKRATVSAVNLAVDQRANISITLQPGAVAESITVNGSAAGQLATDSASLGNVIHTSQVQNLPLPSRNILNLLSITPGVSSGGDATGINPNQLSINGSRTVNSEFTVDGVSVVSGSTGGVQTLPPADAIREFKVLTSAY